MKPEIAPLVLTSVDFGGDMDWQLQCARAWIDLDVRFKTLNSGSEGAKLAAAGLQRSHLLTARAEELVPAGTSGGTVPSIAAVAARMEAGLAHDAPVLLVRPDILPAVRSKDALAAWLLRGPALGLTAEACVLPELYRFSDHRPVQGSLAGILFSTERLGRAMALARGRAGTRAVFGSADWDLTWAQVLTDPEIGGHFLDSGLLLQPGARDIFAPPPLPGDVEEAGLSLEESLLRSRIRRECTERRSQSNMVKALFFSPPRRRSSLSPSGMALARDLMALRPSLDWTTTATELALLADRARQMGAGMGLAERFFVRSHDPLARFSQALVATLFCLWNRPGADPFGTAASPSGHRRALAAAREAHPAGSAEERAAMALLFGRRLINDGSFEPALFNYLIESCETDDERVLLSEISSATGSMRHAA